MKKILLLLRQVGADLWLSLSETSYSTDGSAVNWLNLPKNKTKSPNQIHW